MKKPGFQILVIEDSPGDQVLIGNCLAKDPLADYDLACVDLLESALELLNERSFDLALLDLGLPDSIGLETLISLHQAAPHLPVIVLSGRADEGLALQAVQAGAQDYLVKGRQEWGALGRAVRYAIERIQSELRFSAIFQVCPTPQLIVSGETGRILEANAAYCRLVGQSPAGLFNQKPLDFGLRSAPDGREKIVRLLQENGRVQDLELELQTESGQPLFLLASLEPIEFHGEGCLLASAVDITRRKQAERQLQMLAQELEQRVQQRTAQVSDLYENAPAGYHSLDANACIVMINQTELDWLGYAREDVIGRPFQEFLTPHSQAVFLENFPVFLQCGRLNQLEMEYVCRDGSIFPALVSATAIYNPDGSLLMSRSTVFNIRERKQAEQALRESEEKFRALFESRGIAFAIYDLQGLQFIDANGTFAGLYGHTRQELTSGMTLLDLLAENQEYRRRLLDNIQAAAGGKDFIFAQTVHRKKSGEQFPVEVHGSVHTLNGRKVVYVMVKDISERLQAEQAAFAGEAEKRAILNSLDAQIALLDEQGMITSVNQSWLDFAGQNGGRLEAIQAGVNYLAACDRAAQETGDVLALAAGRGIRDVMQGRLPAFELEIPCDSPTVKRWFLMHVTPSLNCPGGVVVSHNPITAQKQAEQALRESEEKFRLLFEHMQEGFSLHELILDEHGQAVDFRFLAANRAYERHTGLSPEQVLGRTMLEVMPNASREQIAAYARVALTGEPMEFEYYSHTFERHLHVQAFCPQPGRFATIFEDITERVRADQALRHSRDQLSAANAALERAARLKDEFLSNMSHELRTPLTGILGLSEALQFKTYGDLSERQLKAVKNIESSGKHLLALINDILDLSKLEAGMFQLQAELIAVEDICRASLQLIRGMAHKKLQQVGFSIQQEHLSLQADPRRLKQMLVNLLSNAVKFTPQGGELGLAVSASRDERLVRLAVWDTGIGIAPEELPRLFQPFVQLDGSLGREYTGSGLGLALVQRMAELHGGRVEVESTPGVGSRFTLLLPWSEPPGPAAEPPAPSPQQLPLPPDDPVEALDPRELEQSLQTLGVQPVFQPQWLQAVETAARMQPEAILLDLRLPGLLAPELLAALRADPRTRHIPLLAWGSEPDRPHAMALGAAGFLPWPCDLETLRRELSQAIPGEKLPGTALLVARRHPQPAVLLVDDDETILDTFSNILGQLNFQVTCAQSGSEALDTAPRLLPDVILMDIQMPGMNGMEAIRRLRLHADPQVSGIPVIALTALAMPGDRERCLEAGAYAYLSKPFRLLDLVQLIHQVTQEQV